MSKTAVLDQGILTNENVTDYVGRLGSLFFDPVTTTLRFGDGTTPGGIALTGFSAPPIVAITYSDESESANDAIGGIPDSSISWAAGGAADVLFTVTTTDTVSASGVLYFYSGATGIAAGAAASGANGARILTGMDSAPFIAVAFATTANGTMYSSPSGGNSRPLCLAEGTLVTLWDRSTKTIENITYDDQILVWNFDKGCFTKSNPLWIKKATNSKSYNLLTFDDGSVLRTVGQHRIFNKESGSFTYPLTMDTPLGTTTFTHDGKEITLVDKTTINEETRSYNVITNYHLNLFANGILTSNSFNNIYPIMDMRFIKNRVVSNPPTYENAKMFYGMRLAEQDMTQKEIKTYIDRMLANQA